MKRASLSIAAATIWISISEFVRNTFLLREYWVAHFAARGQTFPEEALNGAVWGIWSLCFAIGIYVLSRKFTMVHTALLSWLFGFVCMWLVIGNLGVLPFGILPIAVPLSLFEVFLAVYIINRVAPGAA